MKIAIPYWQGRVSPVFDVAATLLVVEVEGNTERSRQDVPFQIEEFQARAARLAELGVGVLVCGAISRPMEIAVRAQGIEVVPQTCGDLECVLHAYVGGRLDQASFLMPGCCGRRRRRGRGQCGQSGRDRQWNAR